MCSNRPRLFPSKSLSTLHNYISNSSDPIQLVWLRKGRSIILLSLAYVAFIGDTMNMHFIKCRSQILYCSDLLHFSLALIIRRLICNTMFHKTNHLSTRHATKKTAERSITHQPQHTPAYASATRESREFLIRRIFNI
jgi:hypothetical protein